VPGSIVVLKFPATRQGVPSKVVNGFQLSCTVPKMLLRGRVPTTSIPSAARSSSSTSPSIW
jgi:hypothetical protein